MTTARTARLRDVARVPVTEWPGSSPTVVGLPGLGSGGVVWAALAAELPDARVLSVDLRGRGAAQGRTGPTGLRAHARDVAGVLAELDLHGVVLAGHSMGAYLAPLVAQEAPGRVARLVLIDGGIRPVLPRLMGPAVTRLVFRRQLRKLDREWPSVEALAAAGQIDRMTASHPELRPAVLAMLASDLGGRPGALRPRADVERCARDAADTFHGADVRQALETVRVPVHLILAEHKQGDNDKPFLNEAAVAPWVARLPQLTVERLPGNHVTVFFAPEVARAVAG